MLQQTFTYSDSLAGLQNEAFPSLTAIVSYIESFGWNGDSVGVLYADDEPILEYNSTKDSITWEGLK